MENQLVTAIVILDLSAAFNTVNHTLLLDILDKRFGIAGKARKWYESYLQPRKFRVEVGKERSQPRQLDYYHKEAFKEHFYLLLMHPPLMK